MNGIVLIDKPKGWTSFDVVAKIRSQLKHITGIKKPKVGHTGTLDPLATGLLVIVIGSYTKRAQEFTKLDKVYEAELILGSTSTTDDEEGVKTKKSDQIPAEREITETLNTFIGEIHQVPPAFSTIKIDGKRAYKLARDGKQVEIKPRKVTVHKIKDIKYDYPRVKFTVSVSSGTYIRSLARDIGESLGTGAYLSVLRRTRVGNFSINNALQIDSFTTSDIRLLDQRSP